MGEVKRPRDAFLAGELELPAPLRPMSGSPPGRGFSDPHRAGARDVDDIDVLCERPLAFAKDHESPGAAGCVVAREARLDQGDAAVITRSPAVDDRLQDVGGNDWLRVGNDPGGLPPREQAVPVSGPGRVTVVRCR